MGLSITPTDPRNADISALIARHMAFCDGTAPPESCHRLPSDALAAPDITFWAARSDQGTLLGMGALKALSPIEGEIKSMHTAEDARGLGIARQILNAILSEARARGYASLWLETGAHPNFAPARALYARRGFVETGPFGDYQPDSHSIFMTLPLQKAAQ